MTASFGADIPPRVGLLTPARIFKSVDFPAPFFPIKAILSLSLITKETSLKRVVPLNSTAILSTEIICVIFEGAKIRRKLQ